MATYTGTVTLPVFTKFDDELVEIGHFSIDVHLGGDPCADGPTTVVTICGVESELKTASSDD
jgi:hypothetical protein